MFINTGEELSEAEVDDIVEMPIADQAEVVQGKKEGGETASAEEEILAQAMRAAEGVAKILGLEVPTEDRVKAVLAEVKEYEAGTADHANAEVASTSTKKGKAAGKEPKKNEAKGMVDRDMEGKKKGNKSKEGVRYFALLPEIDLVALMNRELEKLVQAHGATDSKIEELMEMWNKLKSAKRVTKRPHVTIVHRNSIKQSGREEGGAGAADAMRLLWNRCADVNEMLVPPVFQGTIKEVVWSDKVMAMAFEDLVALVPEATEGDERAEEEDLVANTNDLSLDESMSNKDRKIVRSLVADLPEEVKRRLHVTVGTRDGGVAPVEGKFVLERWRDQESGGQAQEEDEGEDNGEVFAVAFSEPVKVRGLLKGLYA